MGYPLFREVKVGAPAGLTHREKLVAMVLADDANDHSRLTHSSTVSPEILEQAMVKTDREMRKILARLVEMKVLEAAASGHNGCTAKYRFLHISPDGCPGGRCRCPIALAVQKEPATDAPETDEDEAVAGPETPAYAEPEEEADVPKRTGYSGVGGSFWSSSRSKKNLPTPSSSSTTTTTSSVEEAAEDERQQEDEQPKTDEAAPPVDGALFPDDVDIVCNHLADVLERTGSPRPKVTAKWRRDARLLLTTDGITAERAMRAIDWAHADDFWTAHILTPAKLREKFDTLRRKATVEHKKRRGSVRAPVATPDDWKNQKVEIDV